MTEQHSIASVRRNLPTLVREAENGRPVELTRRCRPAAVLIGCREFQRLKSGRHEFAVARRSLAESVEPEKLALDPDELFGNVRQDEVGYGVSCSRT